MNQIPLGIKSKLCITPEDFVLHAGLRDALEAVVSSSMSANFRFSLVLGAEQSGKTHASVWLRSRLEQNGRRVELVLGNDLLTWLSDAFNPDSLLEGAVVIVDDIDAYLLERLPGDSSSFVRLYEGLRHVGGSLIGFTSTGPSDFPGDEHIMSRVNAAEFYAFEPPDEKDITELIRVLAKQRGLQLGGRKTTYVKPRIGREVKSLVQFLDRLESEIHQQGTKATFPTLAEALQTKQ